MKRFKKILAPTDFSAISDAGLRYADFLAEKFGSEVVVFHVLTHKEMEQKEDLPPPPVAWTRSSRRPRWKPRAATRRP